MCERKQGFGYAKEIAVIYVYLCEDEEVQLRYFRKIIEEYIKKNQTAAKIVSVRGNPEETLADFERNEGKPALFFIDIQLGRNSMDGFELAKRLKTQAENCYLVFLTSQEGLAFRAFEYELGILEYIVKRPQDFLVDGMSPFLESRMRNVFERVEKEGKEQLRIQKRRTITVECGSCIVELPVDEILFVESVSEQHWVEICCSYQKYRIKDSLKNIHMKLGQEFLYANKSCIVQRDKIREINKKERFMTLEGGYKIEISFRKLKLMVREFQDK